MRRSARAFADRRLALVLLIGTTLNAGCGGMGVPVASVQPPGDAPALQTLDPTPAPSPSRPTARPTDDAWQGPPTAIAVRGGIRLELWLPEGPVVIGEFVVGRVRVTNGHDRAVEYDASCGVGRITLDHGALLPAGREWPGLAGVFKARFLRERDYGLRHFIDAGPPGCGTTTNNGTLEPGQVVEAVHALDPVGHQVDPIGPGSARIFATFSYRSGPSVDPEPPGTVVTVPVDVTIVGSGTTETPLATYVDKVLAEPRFIEWLALRGEETWNGSSVMIWTREEGQVPDSPCFAGAGEGAIEIGLYRMGDPDDIEEEYGGVLLDLTSGEVLASHFGLAHAAELECR
jgi:hypothetical protein